MPKPKPAVEPTRKRLKHVVNAIGLDEAGRGPLAGPVVAAAVLLPERFTRKGLDDSKRLTALQRAELESRLLNTPHAIVVVEPKVIDEINILQASLQAMEGAWLQLLNSLEEDGEASARRVLIDGNQLPAGLKGIAEAVIGGDGRYACIAAASILAKTARDRLMTAYAETYPEYGFERHFGYATPEHREALERFGPCPLHRRSFAPVAKALGLLPEDPIQHELIYA